MVGAANLPLNIHLASMRATAIFDMPTGSVTSTAGGAKLPYRVVFQPIAVIPAKLEYRLGNLVHPAEISRLRAGPLLSHNTDNLLLCKSLLLHVSVLNGPGSKHSWRKFAVAGNGRKAA